MNYLGPLCYRPVSEIPNREDPTVAKYLAQCSDLDYFSPLLELMQEAAGGKKSLEEQNAWILQVYHEIIDRKIDEDLNQQIALNSAPKLIEILNDLYNGQGYRSYYSVLYNTAYKIEKMPLLAEANLQFEGAADDENLKGLADIDCLDVNSVIMTGAFPSNPQFTDQLKNCNPIPFFIYVWSAADSVLWQRNATKLQEAVLKEGLQKVFPGKGELYQIYLNLFPIVSNLFKRSRNHCVALTLRPDDYRDYDPRRRGDLHDCGQCIIL